MEPGPEEEHATGRVPREPGADDPPQSLTHPPASTRERAGDDVAPTSVPATSPFGITVPVPIVSDRELGIGRVGAHAADAPPRVGALFSRSDPLDAAGTSFPADTGVAASPVTSPARAILLWAAIALLLIAAFVSAIGALNRGLYSASGFVGQYLSTLQDGDASHALAFPGVRLNPTELAAAGLPADAADTLLRDSVLRGPSEVHLLSDTDDGHGLHTVVYRVKIDGTEHDASFQVARDGSWAGVFHSWRFAVSPVAAVAVTVQHDSGFTVNGLTLDTRVHAPTEAKPTFTNSADYLVLTPAVYEFSRSTALLEAPAQPVVLASPGTHAVSLDVQPTASFVSQVQSEIDNFLDECATQQVLQPTGCPFGTVIDDRVIGSPAWSIVTYPVVALTADDTGFQMPSAGGTAHVVVQVQSLFDGDEETVDRDEPYEMGATVTIAANGTLNIQLH